jgi:threonine/homoserine/homoserine lactone efflux protein
MTDLFSFALAILALLMTPGPTNTLLAAAGATAGFCRSMPLMCAEFLGYSIALTTLILFVAPLAYGSTATAAALRVICGLYLARTAWKLWAEPLPLEGEATVEFRRVFFTTLFNPKALVMSFVLLPGPAFDGRLTSLAPYLAVLAILIFVAGASWIAAGALIRSGTGEQIGSAMVRKSSSVVLASFAGALLTSVLSQGL